MKLIKITFIALSVFLAGITLSGCENTHVSGSMSYGMGMGGGYPMYYGAGYPRHTSVVVVRPPRQHRSRSRPSRTRR
ncbi:hypothetical protein [Colwellia psychrerythraea]|uniref:Lipoprotein n=1 Tax=Colwellia psychrerythraea TaxID=28229 RepID=A0A099KJG2_COLPS|nr:hypothetical protein [Colwellia psychrerythraea]KGJ90969.1 hypothetical protein GAB14E_0633 [Colwellia psychrerythraea]